MVSQSTEKAGKNAALPLVLGSNQSGMRAHNERLVLTLIRQNGPLAKAEIARLTGLSAQTVSVIMRHLETDGLLIKGDPIRGKVGQPSVPMRLDPRGAFFFGLKVGRRSVEIVMTDFLGSVLFRANRTYAYPTPEVALEFTTEKTAEFLEKLHPDEQSRVAGLGIAMPFFLLDWAGHLGVPPEKMAAWRGIDFRAEVAANHDFPVYLHNDTTAACGAEVVFGTGDPPPNFLYFYLGYFVGGGVVLNGSLFSGSGNAGALGPLPVPTSGGETSPLIDVASLSGLEAKLNAHGTDTTAMWETAQDWDFDPAVVSDWISQAANGLAHAIIASCSVIDFAAVLIDGWLPQDLRTELVSAVDGEIERITTDGLVLPDINPGTVGADARALGAASLPLGERFLIEGNAVASQRVANAP